MEVEFLKRIVREAEGILKERYEVHQKGNDGDLVTDLDYKIEEFLTSRMKEHYPDYSIVSEEFNSDKEVTDNCFIIDPIDGTVNFANGLPLWGIQVACRKNGETVASVIDLPRINELYYADETGAYLNDEKISVRVAPLKSAVYSIIGSDDPMDIQRMRQYSRNYRNFGAVCAAMSFVASGRVQGVVFKVDQPWDYEPGLFLCKMAGAKVGDKSGFHAAASSQEFLDIMKKTVAGEDF